DIRGMHDLATPLVLGLAVLFWVTGFDILYACQDVAFDRKAKLSSIPAKFGVPASLRLALVCHVLMLVCLTVLGWLAWPALKGIYLGGVAGDAILLGYAHTLVPPDHLARDKQAVIQVM